MKFPTHAFASAVRCKWLHVFPAIAIFFISFQSYSQQAVPWWDGGEGIQVTVKDILAQQKYLTDNNLIQKGNNRRQETNEIDYVKQKYYNPESPKVSSYKAPGFTETNQSVASSYTVGTSFDAVSYSNITQGWTPPDPMVACGPTQLCVTVNGRIRVFDKLGNLTFDIDADVFFPAALRGNSNAVDPRVRYDPTSQRWFITAITIVSTNNRILIAVSSGPTITDQTSFTMFQFAQNKPAPQGDNNLFADYETLGVDANALYIGCNMFNSQEHSTVWVVRKSKLLTGQLQVVAFRNIGNSSIGGIYTPQGVSNDDPAASEGYFVGTDYNVYGKLVVKRITFSAAGPAISADQNITTPSTAFPLDVPNKNGSSLAAIDARLLLASIHKDVNTGQSSIWCSHSIRVNSSGVGTSTGDRDAVRWYQLGTLTTVPSLLQSGTLYDNSASPIFYWMGTICMNNNGDAVISCSSSSAATFASGAVTAHFASSGAGTTQAPTITTVASGGYFSYRWGDYSASCLDPSDNTTFWCAHEYIKNSNYVVRVVKVTVTNAPAAITATAENAVAQNDNWNAVLFPNPADQNIKIQLDKASNVNIRFTITDVNGKVMMDKTIAPGTASWMQDIRNLPKGFYFANMTSEDGMRSKAIKFEKN